MSEKMTIMAAEMEDWQKHRNGDLDECPTCGSHRINVTILGHRPPNLGGHQADNSDLLNELRKVLGNIAELHPDAEITGLCPGSLGAAWIGARAFFAEKVPFWLVIPFEGHHLKWPTRVQKAYGVLKSHAIGVFPASGGAPNDDFDPNKKGAFSWAVNRQVALLAQESQYVVAIYNGDKNTATSRAVETVKVVNTNLITIHVNNKGEYLKTTIRHTVVPPNTKG